MPIRMSPRQLARLVKGPKRTPKPPAASEREVQKAVVAFLESRGCLVIRCNSGAVAAGEGSARRFVRFNSAPGCSDLLACVPRVAADGTPAPSAFVALEVKREGGRLTDKQRGFLDSVTAAGGVGAVIRSVSDAEAVLAALEPGVRVTVAAGDC